MRTRLRRPGTLYPHAMSGTGIAYAATTRCRSPYATATLCAVLTSRRLWLHDVRYYTHILKSYALCILCGTDTACVCPDFRPDVSHGAARAIAEKHHFQVSA
eukprot:3941751-Rhodomonas_salina.1